MQGYPISDLVDQKTVELIDLLDKNRDYGDRTYDQVVDEVRAGKLLLTEGHNLPVIRDATTHRTVKGTGRPRAENMGPQQAAIAEFRRLAVDDIEEVYANIIRKIRNTDDFHWTDLYLKYVIGKVGEVRGGDAVADAFSKLLDMMNEKTEMRRVDVIDG